MRKTALCLTAILLASVVSLQAANADALATLAVKAARSDQGLCLVAGDADGQLTLALARGSRMVVQGLVTDREQAEKLRQGLGSSEVAERASMVWRRTAHLPYLDDLINLVVINDWGRAETRGLNLAEVARVLCPGGVAVIGADAGADANALLAEAGQLKLARSGKLERPGAWIKITKLMNPDFGEWTHLTGGPEMNRVSPDKVFAVPFPEIRWCNGPVWAVGSFGHAVYAGGRSFHLESTWISATNSQWMLVARDAHNGCELWREKIAGGGGLCVDDRRVYCVDGKDLVGRDAATGRIVQRYGPPAPTMTGVIVTSLDDCLIIGGSAVDKESGKVRWSRRSGGCQAAGSAGTVYVFDGQGVEAVNLADGKTVWKVAPPELTTPKSAYRCAIFTKADTVFVQRDSLEEPKCVLTALDRATGAMRWSRAHESGAILPYDDAVYLLTGVNVKGNPGPKWAEWDIKTGKEVRALEPVTFTGGRCWFATATERFITSLEESTYFDRKAFKTVVTGRGVRSQCKVGPAFAYGLMYNLPHACNCGTVLRGVSAVSGGSRIPRGEVAPALIGIAPAPAAAAAGPDDWPVYRGNPARNSSCTNELPAKLKPAWSVALGKSSLTQATGAGGRVFVADPDAHRVVALDLATGKKLWTFVAEGRVPLAPTLHKGLCLIADHAGWVYCLDAASGKPVWQLQAAPEQKYMCAFGQFESSWPVRSGVLVVGDTACFAAGRTGITDGGIQLYAVDPATGQTRWKRAFSRLMPNDVLVSNGKDLFLERLGINPVDGTDARLQGRWGDFVLQSRGYEQNAGNALLDLLGSSDPGQTWLRKSNAGHARGAGQTVAFDNERTTFAFRPSNYQPKEGTAWRCQVRCAGAATWTNTTAAQQMLGMVLAGPHVFAAGIPEFRDSEDKPALWVFASADGRELQRIPLDAAPGMDSLSAVGGRLVLTTVDGSVRCFAADTP
jgi:outer membrane protein assembly factor BamB